MSCLDDEVNRCARCKECVTLDLWEQVDQAISNVADALAVGHGFDGQILPLPPHGQGQHEAQGVAALRGYFHSNVTLADLMDKQRRIEARRAAHSAQRGNC